MANLTGSFSGHIKSQSAIAVPDQSGHDLSLAEVAGTQKSPDANWNNASLTYSGITDIIDGEGTQRGYFLNTRADGDRDWGTFEGRVTTLNGLLTVEGTYQETGGTGKFKGLTGNGTFKTRMTSPRDVEATYQGTYQLATAKAQAG
jgi:hypothetical protein